ncbi:hypothetical protein HHL22_02335 [Hymenobacter sp. RP-2-7]|uniref:Uncharacterized protein n=1 Tax=Hymenobacter polaris TaxID=2682546 RepID=A0A7Y0FL60_9BACT|nr:hypothetical protein [Hymenobacter polaris]NML64034.1 hypothetical protein [Hymenobacter polaris]
MRRVVLCYRKLIDAQSARPWDQLVFTDSYRELRLQAQQFNPAGQHRTFGELLHHVPAAERLHGLVSGAVLGYLRQLDGLVPDLADNLGRRFLRFENFRFEIVNSHLQDQSQHRIAINFFTDPLYWHEPALGPFLLLSPAPPDATTGEQLTHLLQLQPFLAIHALLP